MDASSEQAPQGFKAGAQVYGLDGYAYSYVAPVGERHVVRPLLEDDEEGEEQIVARVFGEPPVHRQHEEVARLDALIGERRETLEHFDQQAREMRRTLDRNPSIAALVDLLAGKPVYFVTDNGDVIETGPERRYREAVVTFEHRSDGPHFWFKTEGNHYGSSQHGCVYQTREQAIGRVRQVIAEGMARGDRWGYQQAVTASKGIGEEPPAGAVEKLREALVVEAEKALAYAQAQVADAEKKLAAARSAS